jgi:hypothetical protein
MRPRHVIVPAFIAYMALAAGVAVRKPRWAAVMMAPYAVALAAASARTGKQLAGAQEKAAVAPAFLAMHVGWGVGFWAGVGSAIVAKLRPSRKQR